MLPYDLLFSAFTMNNPRVFQEGEHFDPAAYEPKPEKIRRLKPRHAAAALAALAGVVFLGFGIPPHL